MKKQILLMFSGLLTCGLAFGQSNIKLDPSVRLTPKGGHKAIAAQAKNATQMNEALPLATSSSETAQAFGATSRSADVVGSTYYDLQTNNGIMRRVAIRANGDVSCAWTMSPGESPWTVRGTGYNVRKNGVWGPAPTTTVEGTTRTGFSNLVRFGDKDLVVAHGGTPLAPQVSIIDDAGVVAKQALTSVTMGALWFRVAVDGQKIHIIGISNPGTAAAPTPYLGSNGHLLYWRSQDGGTTWDKQAAVIPGIDSTTYKSLTADSYSISARDGRVAIGVFNTWNNSDVFISDDNGNTFAKTTLLDFPLDNYVFNSGYDASMLPLGAGTVDDATDTTEVFTSDNAGNVLVGTDGLVHVAYSTTNVTDQDLTDAGWTYYPSSSGIFYWNEGMTAPEEVIPNLFDVNGDTLFDNALYPDAALATYGAAASTDPVLSISPSGKLVMSFRAAFEESVYANDNEYLNHTFMVESPDAGVTWNGVIDIFDPIFNDNDDLYWTLAEGAYASMPEVQTDGKIRLVYQRDFEPDTYVNSTNGGDPHSVATSEIVFFEISEAEFSAQISGVKTVAPDALSFRISPNPAIEATKVQFALEQTAKGNVEVVNLMGQTVVRTTATQFNAGINQVDLNTAGLPTGVYMVRLNAGNETATRKLVITQR